MTTSGLNKRLSRLQANGNLRQGIGARLQKACDELRLKRDESLRLGLTEAEIEAREVGELRARVAMLQSDTSPLGKRLLRAVVGLLGDHAAHRP